MLPTFWRAEIKIIIFQKNSKRFLATYCHTRAFNANITLTFLLTA